MTSIAAFPTLAPFGTLADQPLRVLTPELSARIAKVNVVLQILAGLDIHVASQDLRRSGRAPLLTLFRGDMRLRRFAYAVRLNGDIWTASINGVDVQWPASATAPLPIPVH